MVTCGGLVQVILSRFEARVVKTNCLCFNHVFDKRYVKRNYNADILLYDVQMYGGKQQVNIIIYLMWLVRSDLTSNEEEIFVSIFFSSVLIPYNRIKMMRIVWFFKLSCPHTSTVGTYIIVIFETKCK